MMPIKASTVLCALLACGLLLSGVALSAGDAASVDWYVIGAGGALDRPLGPPSSQVHCTFARQCAP
jgi:hypothetical protein